MYHPFLDINPYNLETGEKGYGQPGRLAVKDAGLWPP